MTFITFIFSLLVALSFSFLLIYAFKRKGPGPFDGFFFFLGIIFLISWVLGGWMIPIEPTYNGESWIGQLLLAITVTLLLVVLIPKTNTKKLSKDRKLSDDELFTPDKSDVNFTISLGLFFWALIFLMLIIGTIQYFELLPID